MSRHAHRQTDRQTEPLHWGGGGGGGLRGVTLPFVNGHYRPSSQPHVGLIQNSIAKHGRHSGVHHGAILPQDIAEIE